MKRFLAPLALATLLVPMLAVAWRVFPISDDAWAALMLAEQGPGAIVVTQHRVLAGTLWDWCFTQGETAKLYGVLALLLFWSAYAWISAQLWLLWFPWARREALLVAALVLTPAATSMHLITLVVLVPVAVPALVGASGVLLLSSPSLRRGWTAVWMVALLGSFLISEFALAAALLGALALVWSALRDPAARKRQVVLGLGLVASSVTGFALFRFVFSRPNLRPDANLGANLSTLLQNPIETALVVPTRLWWMLAGAYGQEMSSWRLVFGEKSTIAAAAFGVVTALAIHTAWRKQNVPISTAKEEEPRASGWPWLLLFFCASLLPEIARQSLLVMGRGNKPEDLSTRFLLQALPFAACLTVAAARALISEPRRAALVVFVGFLAGHTVFAHSYERLRRREAQVRLGESLRPYVANASGLVVAVLPDYLGREYEVIYWAARQWPLEERRRLWVMWAPRAKLLLEQDLPSRQQCGLATSLDGRYAQLRREGKVAEYLWVEPLGAGRGYRVEPYCAAR